MLSRRMFYSMALIVAVGVLAAGCSTTSTPTISASGPVVSQPAVAQLASTGRGITVVGTGKASGAPDVAHVNIGVETQAASIQQAVADNKAKMTKLLEALKALGIADKDIQTTNYGVYTERTPIPSPESKGTAGPITYHVNNQVSVTVRDAVGNLGDVLDKTVAAGANNIYGVSFGVADTSKLEGDARAKAIADAKARAESLAKLTGVTLGDVMSVSEVLSGAGPVFDRATIATGLGGGAPIQPGELEVSMSIQVTFAIK